MGILDIFGGKSVEALVEELNLCAEEGKDKEAVKILNQLIKKEPDNPVWWDAKGNFLGALGKFDEALDCLDKATDLDPGRGSSWLTKATLLKDQEQFEDAAVAFDTAIKSGLPSLEHDAFAWYELGLCLKACKAYEDAFQCFEQASELDPNNPEPWIGAGQCLYTMSQVEGAVACLEQALVIDPDCAEAYLFKGYCEDALNKTPYAIDSYKRFLNFAEPEDSRIPIIRKRLGELTGPSGIPRGTGMKRY